MGMTISTAGTAAAQANLDFANEILAGCFDPARPDEFARYCTDERGRFMFAAFASAFPDARFHVDWMVADGRRVVLSGRTRATHGGTWRGVQATGRQVDVATVTSIVVNDGRVADLSVVTDSLSLAEQVGAVEPFLPPACRVFGSR